MNINIDVVGSFDRTREWLNRLGQDKMMINVMEHMGQAGVDSLERTTPKDTGETASSWGYDLQVRRNKSELSWYNTAHPHVPGSIARMIYTGHGTGTGGYVPPRDYITPAMNPIYEQAVYRIVEEMTNG